MSTSAGATEAVRVKTRADGGLGGGLSLWNVPLPVSILKQAAEITTNLRFLSV